jgi:hypothetical protein
MSGTFKWNRREVAATVLVCGAALAFTTSWLTLYTEPVVADTAEKVELSEPVPTVTELPVPVIDAVPAADATESADPAPVLDWSTMPALDLLPLCNAADDEACHYQGRLLGDRCDWVNSPGLVTTWFFNCDDPSLEGVVTSDEPVLPNRTLVPCAQEDSDNCYWDAARMGNHGGTSFITLDGVTYYPASK